MDTPALCRKIRSEAKHLLPLLAVGETSEKLLALIHIAPAQEAMSRAFDVAHPQTAPSDLGFDTKMMPKLEARCAGHILPPDAGPHDRSAGLDLTHRQTPDKISSLLRLGKIRRRQFMELARLAVQLDAKLAPIVEDWGRMKPPLQNAVDLDVLCEVHGVDPYLFLGVVAAAAKKYADISSIIIAALSLPNVVKKSVERALTDEGFKDREALMKHAGFLPQPKGWQVRVLNYAAIWAEVNTNIRKPLPAFEEIIADSDELTGDEE